MTDWLRTIVSVDSFRLKDALDVLLVAGLVYAGWLLIRRTRGAPVAVGIAIFVLLWRFAVALELETLGTILELAVTALPFVIVLLFQNTIRRAFTVLGRNPLFRFFAPPEDVATLEGLALAMLTLSAQRTGALVAIEREVGLRTYVDSGVGLDARVSYELLVALFQHRSPLHDGAVIVSGGRLAAASCLLPLTTKAHLAAKYGSRHRAALGLSEETDAIVLAVSEERGTIAVVRDGDLRTVEAKELRDMLVREMLPATARPPAPALART